MLARQYSLRNVYLCAMCKFTKRKMGNFSQTQWYKGGGRKCNNCINNSVLNPQKSISLQSSVTTVKSPAKAEKRWAADGVPGHHRGIKQKTATSEVELDDGTKIVETQTIESYADGTTVKRIKRILKRRLIYQMDPSLWKRQRQTRP